MIPLVFVQLFMDAKHKIEKEFCRNQCQDRLEKKPDNLADHQSPQGNYSAIANHAFSVQITENSFNFLINP